jgi:tripartite ATP-independent transporter DctP family solute receptor
VGERRPRQFHNQPEQSHQHRFLVDVWDEVRGRTGGALDVSVHASNAGVTGSDPRVLEMVLTGEVEFATMMGPLVAAQVPAAEIQGVPFAFQASAEVHAAMDGPLGEHLGEEMAARGLYLLGTMENGMRHLCSVEREVRSPQDLAGYRIRVPAARVYAELFGALAAVPVTVNIDGLYAALHERRVDGHENPLAITEVNRLYEVTRCISLTSHAWSGFNLVANLRFWQSLSEQVRDAAHRAVKTHVGRQRAYAMKLNTELGRSLQSRGMRIVRVDRDAFRSRLPPELYARWKERCGTTAWGLLEAAVGRLA